MHAPALVSWLLAAVCGIAGGYCLAQLRTGRAGGWTPQRQNSAFEGLMGLSMAAMAVPPGAWPAPPPEAYAVLFSLGAAWSLLLTRAGAGHHGHHLTESAAMIYMSAVMARHGHGGGGAQLLTAGFLLYFAGYALRTGSRLHTPGPAAPGESPEIAAACRLALALAMFTMLLGL